ncbi:MAG: DUF4926 domain-containing protein, partial [Planctomycetes bacterium]|nr:DUF4926 domain-containing protein [Planctomycetota bacterium]
MRFKQLDTVVLDRDLPEHGLRRGDLGAVVEVYEPDGLEVEFVTAAGRTEALVTLRFRDVRSVADGDLIAVRPFGRSAWGSRRTPPHLSPQARARARASRPRPPRARASSS